MAGRCKFCLTKFEDGDLICRVCHIQAGKEKKELTKEEKKIQYYCHALRVTGILCILGGLLGVAVFLLTVFGGVSDPALWALLIFGGFLSVVFLVFGFAVMKYQTWCYVGGIILLSVALLSNLFEFNILRFFIQILLLSYVAAPTSKKILYREL